MKAVGVLVLGLGGTVALGVTVWLGVTRIIATLQPQYHELLSNPTLSDDANDENVITQLRARGSDLTKRTDIVFYLYIPGLRDARAAASTLNGHGFSAEVEGPLGRLPDGSYESRYSVVTHIEEVPSMENLRKDRRLYKLLAQRYKGEYDGWEAAVVQ